MPAHCRSSRCTSLRTRKSSANNGVSAFVTIVLNLDGTTVSFTGPQIVLNGTQHDNVFVAVPAGSTLASLEAAGSYAVHTGVEPENFNLSTVCNGTVPTTEPPTTQPPTTQTAGHGVAGGRGRRGARADQLPPPSRQGSPPTPVTGRQVGPSPVAPATRCSTAECGSTVASVGSSENEVAVASTSML